MTQPDTWTVTIPAAPAYALSPNARTHHMVKAKEARELRTITYFTIGSDHPGSIPGPVALDWIINLPKGRKHMDWDNALTTLKPAMDGLVMAGVIEDDNTNIVTRIGLQQVGWKEHKIDGGELVVTITAVESARKG